MNFETYLNQSWNDHGTNPEKVASEFSMGASLVTSNNELDQLVRLVTHVMGEHLARWNDGISFLTGLKNHLAFSKESEAERSIDRSINSLLIAGGKSPDLSSLSASDQIRIFAVASSALAERDSLRAQDLLLKALILAESGLDAKDPANRALAVTGNNLASALEEKVSRSKNDTELMILAAKTGRKYWEIAGGWLEVSRAEYRLAKTYLQANETLKALQHAQDCLRICREKSAGDLDMFFAYECLALAEQKNGRSSGFQQAATQARTHFEKLGPSDRSWCEASMNKLVSLSAY